MSELTLMLLGAVMYWSARKLSGNSLFYYLICITLGIGTSVIILVYFFSKFLLRVNGVYMRLVLACFATFIHLKLIYAYDSRVK